jgi:hypothetical protein
MGRVSQKIGRDPYHKLNHHRKAGPMKDRARIMDEKDMIEEQNSMNEQDHGDYALNMALSREKRWRKRCISMERVLLEVREELNRRRHLPLQGDDPLTKKIDEQLDSRMDK